MTCLVVWLLQSHRQKIDFTSRILRRWRKLAKLIFSMSIWIVKKLSIFFNWSCNLRRFLSTKSIWVEIEASTKNAYSIHLFFQRFMWKRYISLILWLLKRIASRSNRTEFAQNAKRIVIEDVCLSINYCVIHSCFNSLEMILCIRDLSKSLLNLLVIDLHSLRMMFDMLAICMRYLIWVCSWFRCRSMKTTCVSAFRMKIEMIFETIRKCFVNSDFVWLRICWLSSTFYSWTCVKRKRRRWERSEQRKCTTFESCERSFFRWKSTISWKSWSVSSFFLEFFVRVNLISVVCRFARRKLECRFSTQSCSSQFWSWSSCRTFSNFWWSESARTWSRRTRIHVESLIVRRACAFFRDFDNFLRCFFHKSECWHHRRTREISCLFRVCCTFLINRHYKTDIKSKKTKIFAKFRFVSKTIRSFFDSLREWWSDRRENC
jgi:hypothetical protein